MELAVILGSFYGLRRSEIVGLKWNCIDFERKTITIRHVVTQATINGKYQLVQKNRTKTKSSTRSLPLVPQFEVMLLKMRETQEQNKAIFGDAYCREFSDYIYVDPMGYLIKPGYVTRHFRLVCDNHGLKHISFHDLRHSYATLLYENKVSSANAIIGILPGTKEKELAIAAN